MPVFRGNPYGAFNFLVALGGAQGDGGEGTIIGGFSDVSGLGMEVNYSEYRNGNEKFNTVRKVPNTHKVDDVTLKRGLVGSDDLFAWLKGVRDGAADPRTGHDHAARRGAPAGRHLGLAQRAAEEVDRADAGRQGRRRSGHGRAAPRPRRHRVQVGHGIHSAHSARGAGTLSVSGYPDPCAHAGAHGRVRVRRRGAARTGARPR